MVPPDVVDIGSECFVVYLSCVCICSAGYAGLPVLLYLLAHFEKIPTKKLPW